MQTSKALTHEQNEALRSVLRGIVEKDFGGVKLRAAKALGISHSLLTEILAGHRGAGTKMLTAISNYTRRSIDDLMGHDFHTTRDPATARDGDELGQHPDFPAALLEFRAKMERRGTRVDESIIAEERTVSFSRALPRVSAEFVAGLYEALLQAREDAAGT